MAKQKTPPAVSIPDALEAIEQHIQIRMMWMLKVQTLLQFAGTPGIDQESFNKQCAELAESMPS